MVHKLDTEEATLLLTQIVALEREGRVTRTFRRLDADRQLAIIEAILQEAALGGPASVTMKGVAARAQVAVGSLYQYFPDREGMLSFAAEVSSRYLVACFDYVRPMLADMPLREALGGYLGEGISWSRMYTGFLSFFARAAYQRDAGAEETVIRPLAAAMRETVGSILVAARSRGELRDDVDIDWATRLIHGITIVVGDAQLMPYLNDYFQVVPEGGSGEAAVAAAIDFVVAAVGRECGDHRSSVAS